MFFAVADTFLKVSKEKDTKAIILRFRGVPAMDASALRKLRDLHKSCKKSNVTLILSHVQSQPLSMMTKAGFIAEIGEENVCRNIEHELERAKKICEGAQK